MRKRFRWQTVTGVYDKLPNLASLVLDPAQNLPDFRHGGGVSEILLSLTPRTDLFGFPTAWHHYLIGL